jgi:hypothetical protein
MFFSYHGCTPPDRLYGIIDRSISDDHGLYGPISVGCMALESVRGLYGQISMSIKIHLCLSHAQGPDIDQYNTLMLLLIQPKNKRKTHHRNQMK